MNPTLIELRRRPHTSVSALKTFLTCARRYRLQYIDRVRPDFFSAALALGSAWHEVIALWLAETAGDDELEALLRERILSRLREAETPVLFDGEDETEETFIERALVMFKTFRESVRRPKVVLGTEIPFSIDLADPRTGEVLPVPVVGALDAVVVEDDGVGSLWEHKTTKKRYPLVGGTTEFDPQLTLYRRAARDLGFGDVRLRYLVTSKTKVPQVQVLDVHRTEADEVELTQTFLSVSRAISAGVDHPVRGWQCRSCPYSSRCAA